MLTLQNVHVNGIKVPVVINYQIRDKNSGSVSGYGRKGPELARSGSVTLAEDSKRFRS
jgi:hypothetical protein